MRKIKIVLFGFLLIWGPSTLAADRFTVEKNEEGAAIKLDGKLFTRYQKKYQNKPILHPVIGPTGKEMTRPLAAGASRPRIQR